MFYQLVSPWKVHLLTGSCFLCTLPISQILHNSNNCWFSSISKLWKPDCINFPKRKLLDSIKSSLLFLCLNSGHGNGSKIQMPKSVSFELVKKTIWMTSSVLYVNKSPRGSAPTDLMLRESYISLVDWWRWVQKPPSQWRSMLALLRRVCQPQWKLQLTVSIILFDFVMKNYCINKTERRPILVRGCDS